MRIAVIGAQGVGKSTLVNAIKAYWPAYLSPEKTYRDLIKEKNLTINESGTMESQQVIRDYLVDIALDNAGKDKTIHDRCVLDNLAYTFWLVEHNKLGDDEKAITDFVTTSIILAKESLKFYDVVIEKRWIISFSEYMRIIRRTRGLSLIRRTNLHLLYWKANWIKRLIRLSNISTKTEN
jgi:GTPase SAR1 family protein